MTRLLLLFLVLALVELALLLLMGRYISVGATLAYVILAALAGAMLLRYQGMQTLKNIRLDPAERQLPADSPLDHLMILLAAVLLIMPGVLTDLFAVTLLIPACRRKYRRWLKAWLEAKAAGFSTDAANKAEHPRVIDSTCEEDIED